MAGYVPSPLPYRRPTSWLAAQHLPITPPVSCSDTVYNPTGPIPLRRQPTLSLDLSATTGGSQVVTPPLSYGSSSSAASSCESIPLPESTSSWHFTSPERSGEVDLAHQIALRQFEQKQLANRGDEGAAHPRIVKAPTDRKPGFVEGLVDTAEIAITSIWTTSTETGAAPTPESVLPLRWFIKETLRRSRTSCSTLQLALFYLHRGRMRIRERVLRAEAAKQHFARLAATTAYPSPPASPPHHGDDVEMMSGEDAQLAAEVLASSRDPIVCGRRMFLAALVCASKFLQDRNYSSRAWSKISGLSVQEINANERALLNMLEYQLFVQPELFTNWTGRLEKLANEYAAKHGTRRDQPEEPASPLSPVSSPPRLPMPMRSASEYISAPALGSEMHATLPTPILGEMRPPSSLSTPPKSRAADWARRHNGNERLLDSLSTRPTLNRSCKTDANVASWLASSAAAAPETMV